jgi:hypothetical protein
MPNSVSIPFSSLLASRPFTPRSLATHGSTSTGSTSANVDHLSATYTTLLEPAELARVFNGLFLDAKNEANELEDSRASAAKEEKSAGIELGVGTLDRILRGRQAVVVSCGSGMTAAVIWLALQELKISRPIALYDEVSALVPFCFIPTLSPRSLFLASSSAVNMWRFFSNAVQVIYPVRTSWRVCRR